ncbi:MAG: hypothetical protein JWO38_2008 [Gemmataceae bacterium]|nr:hypothetical protein [Gemmataceae bacterium]
MRLPVIRGVIDRRILVNYRVDPVVLAGLLPAPFRPKLVRGFGMVGVCLIRLRDIRPVWVPSGFGISSENAAHRAAVEWDEGGATREGVYIRRRDTSSRLNAWAGGRVFPGVHHRARFEVRAGTDQYHVALRSTDGVTAVSVRGRPAGGLPASSVFRSLEEASEFFRTGSVGYSATRDPSRFHGLELRCAAWHAEPLAMDEVRSSYFEDRAVFPAGSVEFDCALLMRGIEHEWHGRGDLCSPVLDTSQQRRE